MMRLNLLLIIALLISCKKISNSSVQFLPLTDDFLETGKFLIKNVHRTRKEPRAEHERTFWEKLAGQNKYKDVDAWYPSEKGELGWLFAYGFDKSCHGKKYDEQEIKEAIGKYVRLWLKPIKDIATKEIVDNFYYRLFPAEATDKHKDQLEIHGLSISRLVLTHGEDEPHWKFIFYCPKSHFRIRPHMDVQATIHTNLTRSDDYKSYVVSRETGEAFLHELGHAFGLHDTYLGHRKGQKRAQAMSVMSGQLFHNRDGELMLSEDDTKGIRYLYQLYHNKDAGARFSSEYSTVFEYPAIFEVNQAFHHYLYHGNSSLIEALEDAIRVDYVIDEQRINSIDSKGYAVLHYLVRLGHLLQKNQASEMVRSHWLAALQSVLDNPDIEINIQTLPDQYTPLHLAIIHEYIPAIKLLSAKKKQTAHIVDASGKTALDHALAGGNQEIIALLKKNN